MEESGEEMLTREEVKNKISAYLQSCITMSQDEETQEFNYVWKRNPTKSGLALALSVSPQTLIDYVKGSDRRGNTYKPEEKIKADRRLQQQILTLSEKPIFSLKIFMNRN